MIAVLTHLGRPETEQNTDNYYYYLCIYIRIFYFIFRLGWRIGFVFFYLIRPINFHLAYQLSLMNKDVYIILINRRVVYSRPMAYLFCVLFLD